MKCPACQLDSKKADRPDGACPQCKRAFRLDPPIEGFSDYAVDAAIKKLTDNLAHKYVKRQLVALFERRLVAKQRTAKRLYVGYAIVGGVVAGIGVAIGVFPLVIPYAVLLMIFSIIYFAGKVDAPQVAQQVVARFGSTPHEVAPRELPPARRGAAREFDLESYGFDRVIVVQGDDIAEMLVANQFHFQHNAAILSLDGYPQHVANIVDQQLAQNQSTTVVLLHDASLLGYGLAQDWLQRRRLAPGRVIRAGLSPRQVTRLGPKHPPMGQGAPSGLPAPDLLWLQGQSVTLASLKPSQIMTLLFNAIQRRPGEALQASAGNESDYLIVGSDGGYDFGLSERPAMRCPKCVKESTKKERSGGKCPSCGWEFRFDPPAPLSDYEVEHAVQAVSRKGAHRYTRAQLVAEVERVLVKRTARLHETAAQAVLDSEASPFVWVFALGLVIVGLILLGVFQELCGSPLLVVAVIILIARLFRRDPKVVAAEIRAKSEPFDVRAAGIVDRYLGRDVPTLLVEPPDAGLSRETSRHAAHREFDLESYGFDRVIVVQGDENVDMLVKNQFHFQHNAAIVSFDGYPSHVASLVKRQLEAGESSANVFLLHDADAAGARLVKSWREASWTKHAQIHDVGLAPSHAARLLPRRPLAGSGLVGGAPTNDEVYTADYRVPLAVLRPEQMMTLLFNAITAVERGRPITELHAADTGEAIETTADIAYDFG